MKQEYMNKIKEVESSEYMSSLNPQDFSINNIPATVKNAFIDGSYSMNKKWMNAFKTFCEESDIDFKDASSKIGSILNK